MPFHSYILKSVITGRRYYGSCENMEKRFQQHNSGRVKSTKAYIPYTILYFEIYSTRKEAFAREKFFKTLDGYNYLKKLKVI